MTKYRVNIQIQGHDQPRLMMIPTTATIGELLEHVQSQSDRSDLAHVSLNGSILAPGDSLKDHYTADAVFLVTPGNTPADRG